MAVKYYTIDACETLMNHYCEIGGYAVTVEDGTLGLGIVVCFGDGLKATIITERAINAWQSYHTIRQYNEMPKKYAAMLDAIGW